MKKILKIIWTYLFTTTILILPVFIFIIGLDFIINLKVDFFDPNAFAFLRIVFYFWVIIVNVVYIWTEFKEEIKNIY